MCALLLAVSPLRAATPPASATAHVSPGPLVVGVKVAPPFVIADGSGYRGLAIDLWKEVAADHGWKFSYRDE